MASFCLVSARPPISTLFPHTTHFRSPAAPEAPVYPADARGAAKVPPVGDLYPLRNASGSPFAHTQGIQVDRKSTRLNSSHANISYAVFCLKKKLDPGGVRNDRLPRSP